MAGISLTVSALATTEAFGSITVGPFTITGTIAPVATSPTLASGDNVLNVPANASGFVFNPPATNTFALKLKGATTDTGISIPKTSEFIYQFDPAAVPASIDLNAAGATGQCSLIFF